jgi:hypothetical protein
MNQEVLVRDMVRTLKLPKVTHPRPIAVTFVGAPATGKTDFALKLSGQMSLVYFSNEQIESYLTPHVNFFGDNKLTLNFSFEVIKELIKQKISVVFDYSIDTISDRKKLRSEIESLGGQMLILFMECSDEEVFRRIQHSNVKIVEGIKKGFILNQDYYLFKKSKIQSPLSEDAFIVNCDDRLAADKFISLIQSKLSSTETKLAP